MAGMYEFQGFSDREIRNLQQRKQERGKRQANFPAKTSEKSLGNNNPRRNDNNITSSSSRPNIEENPSPTAAIIEPNPGAERGGERGGEQMTLQSTTTNTNPDTEEFTAECDVTNLPNLHMENKTVEKGLELLQKQQKALEEENKKTKALLEHTIQERYARSQEEGKKLEAVKNELARLDTLLNRDVAILRLKIEDANRQYATARKRYETAEAEFVVAKLALHKTSETKELLSEHLCTIIQQNEVRKSEKLAELTRALELEGGDNPTNAMPTISLSEQVLFQKTPTPGIDIWPPQQGGKNCKESSTSRGSATDREPSERCKDRSMPEADSSSLHNNSGHDNNAPLISL